MEEKSNEHYIPFLKYSLVASRRCPYHIEWMRFDQDCQIPEIVKTISQLAFEFDDLAQEL